MATAASGRGATSCTTNGQEIQLAKFRMDVVDIPALIAATGF